jgi:hypothetical protein
MKFGRDRKVVLKKSFQLYRKVSVRTEIKVGLNFVHFACHGQKGAKFSKYLTKFSSQFSQN